MLTFYYPNKYIRIYIINMRNYCFFYRFGGHCLLDALFLVVAVFFVKRDGLPLLTPLEGLFLVLLLAVILRGMCHPKSFLPTSMLTTTLSYAGPLTKNYRLEADDVQRSPEEIGYSRRGALGGSQPATTDVRQTGPNTQPCLRARGTIRADPRSGHLRGR